MKKNFYILVTFLSVIFPPLAMAGENPAIVYATTNGRIDTATDTSSDGYMRNGTQLVVDCSATGACVTTPTPPLPPTEGPVANPDSYAFTIREFISMDDPARLVGWTLPHALKKYKVGKAIQQVDLSIYFPVMTNDRAGPYGPTRVTSITNATMTSTGAIDNSTSTIAASPSADGKSVNVFVKFMTDGFKLLRGPRLASSPGDAQISFDYTITDSLGQSSKASVAITITTQVSPLVLDLDGDGIEMVPLSQGVLFDIDMDGVKDKLSWIKSDDGFLVLDRNNDGMITHRRELFGNLQDENLDDGFASLLRYDDNKDYVMDAQDKIFPQLLVWRDLNKDGVGTPNELKPASAYGIVSFNLNAVKVGLVYGAAETTITHQSTYTLKDGSTRQMADVWFANIMGQKPVQQTPHTPTKNN